MDRADIPFLSASELSRLIQKREVSPVEATEAYLDRIDALNFKFNAYFTVSRDEATAAAKHAEAASGNSLGPMHGVPFAVKDQVWTEGIRTTGGARLTADFVPEEDSTVVANLKRAGAVLLGKTNMTEFALTAFTHRFSYPRNPWNLDMFTGGSSSGLRSRHRGIPLCHLPGGGHRRLHPPARRLVRSGGAEAQLGTGEPVWPDAWSMVDGYRRTYVAYR